MQLINALSIVLSLSAVSALPFAEQSKDAVVLGSSRSSHWSAHTEKSVVVAADGPEPAGPAGWQESMLNYHNGWRAHHQVPPLTWNDTLAAAALNSARRCQFALTPNNRYGENIAAGTYTNPDWYGYMWYNGSLNYNYDRPGFSYQTGTFTQVVWKDTKQLGCAYVTRCPGGYPNMLFCEYSPAGNIIPDSNFAKQVFRPVANPPLPSPPPMMSPKQ
ncbi:hypothetical protein H072_7700 [Dactylellina haptotyla CBS 200.50]|uniref:SCP domain-containing protein n=1 Tax=Dactylellina haptotyla (strain CBS 200.50) TaxID=1284197 RepID=S8A6U0_DACHA|nr:hypothetical protein H072_7700 [Dactylellina haptotyla CBS 200.50]